MSEKSATEQIRERQRERAEGILSMLPDQDAIDVRLWGKDQYEVGLELGQLRGRSDANRKSHAIGAGVGVGATGLVGVLVLAPLLWALWPWPWSAPVAPDCDARVRDAVDLAVRQTVAGGARVKLPWNETNLHGSTNEAPVEWVQIQGFSCVRETKSDAFLCVPTHSDETELPAVPVDVPKETP